MFTPRLWTRSSRRLLILLLAVVVPPAATLVWLGQTLIDRDRLERRDAAASTAIGSLEASLAETERLLGDQPLPEGLARLTWSAGGIDVAPAARVLWSASPAPGLEADVALFATAEAHEYRGRSVEALQHYTTLAKSPDAAVRAGAIFRAARVHASAGRWERALAAYRSLAAVEGVAVDGAPLDLQGRRAMGDVLERAGRRAELADTAAALESDLLDGRWTRRIDRALWEATLATLARWTGRTVVVDTEREALSAAADALKEDIARAGTRAVAGWRMAMADPTPVTVFVDPARQRALLVSPAHLTGWLERAARTTSPSATIAAAPPGRPAASTVPAGEAPSAIRIAPAQSGLPWMLVLTVGESPASLAGLAARRRLLAVGMGAILLLLGGTSYVVWRMMSRELGVARLQTEFVSAVSHEFRTPLASIRHVTELLDENDALAPDERKAFYSALTRNTDRLQRFVESLLDFSRLEAGRRPYERAVIDARDVAGAVASAFQVELQARGVTVRLERGDAPCPVVADRAALGNALWNLLDNAVKYSPGRDTVWVSVRRTTDGVALAVRDAGLGVPAAERRDIFKRFVRGRQATRLRIGGTGLGLAIVSHVVAAHGATIGVESTEGEGSTFTIVFPLATGIAERPIEEQAGLMGAQG